MTQEYFAFKDHPDVVSHANGVIEIPPHITSKDVPINYWCLKGNCKYRVKATPPVSTTCPLCGSDEVQPLPF